MNLSTLKRICSAPLATIAVFILALAALNAWQAVLPNFHFDNSFSVAAAKNVAEGNGFTTKEALPADLSETVYVPINKWPPGYSWLMAVVMKSASADAVTAVYVVNGFVILFFLAGIYLTLTALRFPGWATNFFLLFAGFFPYPFLGAWFADLAAVSFFMLGIGLIMLAHTTGKNLVLLAIASAIFCSYCIFLKYLYLPVAILPLVVWAWYALRTGKRKQFSAALGGAAIVSAAAVMLLIYQSRHSGEPVYINPTGRGFFPGHALHVGALIPASLIDDHFLSVQLSTLTGFGYHNAQLLLRIINYILMLGLLIWLIRWWRNGGNRRLYPFIMLVVSIATSGMLLYLSLTFAPYRSEFTAFWTYVEELRYYAIVVVFIQQWLFWYFLVHKPATTTWLRKILRATTVIIVWAGITHGAYYLFKQTIIRKEAGINKLNEQTDLGALAIVNRIKQQHPSVIICSNNHELVNIASLSGAPVLYDYQIMNDSLKTSKPVMMLFIAQDKYEDRFRPFMDRYKPAKVGHSYGFSFYLAAIR